MPGTRVEVEVSFKLIETEPEAPAFADVPASAYYADAVAWAVEQGITSGTSATTFSPAKGLHPCRDDRVRVECRRPAKAATTKTVPFTDVPESGSSAFWYEDALLWAYENEIVAGTNEDGTTFSPHQSLHPCREW